jgi:hypothetical protein
MIMCGGVGRCQGARLSRFCMLVRLILVGGRQRACVAAHRWHLTCVWVMECFVHRRGKACRSEVVIASQMSGEGNM